MYLSVLAQFYEWDARKYTLTAVLPGHDGPINAFAFNQDGTLLASGGDDERVRIWDVNKSRQCQALMDPLGRWGQITCLKFVNLEVGQAAEWLCFGTGRGVMVLYRKARKAAEFLEIHFSHIFSAGDSVEAFAFDSTQKRIAISSHYGQIKVLRYQNGKFVELWCDELLDAIPRAVLFGDEGRSLTVFTLESGTVISRDTDTSLVLTTKTLKSSIGYVSQCPSTGEILVDNMSSGFDLYTFNRQNPSHSFTVASEKMFIKAGVFCEGGKVVACGSDHGRVYVFRVGEKQPRQELLHGRRQDMIQSVEAATANGFHWLVSGASSGKKFEIYVWKKPVQGSVHRDGERRQLVETLVATNLIFFLVFLWLTSDVWNGLFETKYSDISMAIRNRVSERDLNPKTAIPSDTEPTHITSLVRKILFELEDDEARRILGMPPALTEEDILDQDCDNEEPEAHM